MDELKKQKIEEMILAKKKIIIEAELDLKFLKEFKQEEINSDEDTLKEEYHQESQKPEEEQDKKRLIRIGELLRDGQGIKAQIAFKEMLLVDMPRYIKLLEDEQIVHIK